jgi:hypothetical protein
MLLDSSVNLFLSIADNKAQKENTKNTAAKTADIFFIILSPENKILQQKYYTPLAIYSQKRTLSIDIFIYFSYYQGKFREAER